MTMRLLLTFVSVVICVPCLAEEMPTVPELLKKTYDYRVAIDNMQAEITVSYPVNTKQPVVETQKQHYYFAYNKGRVRCDMTLSSPSSPRLWFTQRLSTPDFHFTRDPTPSSFNDGNSLFVYSPLGKPFDTFDPRRIGTDPWCFDGIVARPFNYDTFLGFFNSPHTKDIDIGFDYIDGEKFYKVSFPVMGDDEKNAGSVTYWIDPQRGYNLVRREDESEILDLHISYAVTVGKFTTRKGEIWFPQETFFRHQMRDTIQEERIVVDSIDFDVQDETPFTLAGLGIPIGYRVNYQGEMRIWDGKELVADPMFIAEPEFSIAPVSIKSRKAFWIVNAVGFAVLAFLILMKFLQPRKK